MYFCNASSRLGNQAAFSFLDRLLFIHRFNFKPMPLPPAPSQRASLLNSSKFTSNSEAPAAKDQAKEQRSSRGKVSQSSKSSKRGDTGSNTSQATAKSKSYEKSGYSQHKINLDSYHNDSDNAKFDTT
ncbi:MAG: hypothetical protein V9E91_13180 [Burkholderiaceae bacterium]